MPKLLSGGAALQGTTGSTSVFITLPTAQLNLGTTPTTSTGYTLVTGPNGQLGFTSTLGGISFNNGIVQTTVPNGDLILQSNGTGTVQLNGNVLINGSSALFTTSTFVDLTVYNSARFLSTTSNVLINAGLNLGGSATIQGDINAFGNIFFEPYNSTVTIKPTGIGTVEIQPDTTGAIDNMVIGAQIASSATFTDVNASSLTVNGVPVGSGNNVVISDTPPANPITGELWWDSTQGILRVYYNDGDSSQWVDAFPVVQGEAATVTAGTVTLLPSNLQPYVVNSGNSSEAIFDFYLPSGSGSGTFPTEITTTLFINNNTVSVSTDSGALTVAGGMGVGGAIYASEIYLNGLPVLTSASFTSGVSEIRAGQGINVDTSTGVVTISNTDTLSNLIERNSTSTHALTINSSTISSSTTTGALVVAGGVGIGGDVYVGKSLNIVGPAGDHGSISYNSPSDAFEFTGSLVPNGVQGIGSLLNPWNNLYATQIFENQNRVVTSMRPVAGPGIGITYASTTGPVIVFTITNLGISSIDVGTDTAINQVASAVTIWSTATLDSITSRTPSTVNAISITNTSNNALTVAGNIKSGGADVWTRATLTDNSQLTNGAEYLTSSTIGVYGVSFVEAGYGISVSENTGTVIVTNTGVVSLTTGTGISISTSSGAVQISSIDTLQLVTSRGATTNQAVSITNGTASTGTTYGALKVSGGVGVQGNVYAGAVYDAGSRVITSLRVLAGTGMSGGGTVTFTTSTIALTNTGVLSLTQGTDTVISSNTGNIRIWTTSTLQSVTDRGSATSNVISITNGTASTSTTSGALKITGGLGVGGNVYAAALYDNNSRVLTLDTLGTYSVTYIGTGPGISVDSHAGIVTVSNTGTLALATSFGATTPDAISITNATGSTSTTNGALTVAGGVGVGENLNVGGTLKVAGGTTFSGSVTFSGSATYVLSTNTYYTDNILELHTPPAGVDALWDTDDGKDIGLRFHYYSGADKNAALVLSNDEKFLEWYSSGAESGNIFSGGVYGTFKTGSIVLVDSTTATSTASGALIVAGGGGFGGELYVNGAIYSDGSAVITSKSFNSYGVSKLYAGTDTAVTTSSGIVTVWNTSNLQSVTGRGATTDQALSITNATAATSTATGALRVTGGIGIGGDVRIGGNLYSGKTITLLSATTLASEAVDSGIQIGSTPFASFLFNGIDTWRSKGSITPTGAYGLGTTSDPWNVIYGTQVYDSSNRVLTSITINPGTAMGGGGTITGASGSVTIDNLGVIGLLSGTDTQVSSTTGTVTVWNTSNLQSVTGRGATTDQAILITNDTSATTTASGALQVVGGAGIGGALYVGGKLYANNSPVVTVETLPSLGVTAVKSGTGISVNTSTGEVTVTNAGVYQLNAGTDTQVSSTSGAVTVWNTSTLQTITGRGATTTNIVSITNTASATTTASGALRVVGGVGIGGALYVQSKSYITGAEIVTTSTLATFGVISATAGTGISVSTATGAVTITNIGVISLAGSTYLGISATSGSNITLTNLGVQTLTNGTDTQVSSTTGTVTIWNNSTLQTITNRGATTTNAVSITNTASATTTASGALQVVGGVGIGENLYVGGTIYSNGSAVITYNSLLSAGVTKLTAGTGTYISTSTGDVTIWSTATLQSVTALGASSDKAISFTNLNSSLNTNSSQALLVTGGVGVGGNISVGGNIYSNNGNLAITTATVNQYAIVGVVQGSGISVSTSSGVVTVTNTGVRQLNAGTDTQVDQTTGAITVWNNSTLQTITNRGASSDKAISFTNTASSANTNSGQALLVTGGVGIGGQLSVAGLIYSNGSQTITADNLVNFGVSKLNAGTGTAVSTSSGIVTVWSTATLQNVTTLGATTNQALSITNADQSSNPTSGQALLVTGGVGIGGALYTSGNAYFNNSIAVTADTINLYAIVGATSGAGISISTASGVITVTNSGVTSVTNGTDTQVSGTTGAITVWSNSTLQTVTGRGATTNNAISFTNTASSANTNSGQALLVTGGVGIGGNLAVGGTITAAGSTVLTQQNLLGFGVVTVAGGTGTYVSTATGNVTIWSTATLQDVTSRGATTDQPLRITSSLDATTSSGSSGALGIAGGVSINKSLFVGGAAFFGGGVTFAGSATYVNSTNTVYTDNIIELHTPPGGAGTLWPYDDTKDVGFRFHYYSNSTDTNAALVLANDTKALEWYSAGATGTNNVTGGTYGIFKTGAIQLVNTTTSIDTASGALTVVGGVGIGGTLNVGGKIYSAGSEVITNNNIGSVGVTKLYAATGTAVSTSSGEVTVWSTATLQNVTDFGNTTNNRIVINNTTDTNSTNTGALTVAGGVGINGGLYVGNVSTFSNSVNFNSTIAVTGQSTVTSLRISGITTVTNTTAALSTQSGALQVVGGVGVGGDIYVTGKIIGGPNSSAAGTNAAVLGGSDNVASGKYSQASGFGATARGITGANAWGYKFSTAGDAQQVSYFLSTASTTSTAVTLTTDQLIAGTTNQIILPVNSAYGFKGMITARDTTNNYIAVWEIKGGIKNTGDAMSLVGTPIIDRITYDTQAGAWTVSITADSTLKGLKVQVTGAAGISIRWAANITTIEVA